jgi:phage portal protein BeeE
VKETPSRREELLALKRQIKALGAMDMTLEHLIAKAEQALAIALQNQQASAAIAAIKEIGVLSGLRVEKREHARVSANDLSDDELADIVRRGS